MTQKANEEFSSSRTPPHKKPKHTTAVQQPKSKEFTIQCIVDYLLFKYPDYKCYVDKARQYINADLVILNLREADVHITHICKKMKLGLFQTIVVREAVKSTLADRGMPK